MNNQEVQGTNPWYKRWWGIVLIIGFMIGLFFLAFLFKNGLCNHETPDEKIPDNFQILFRTGPYGITCMGEGRQEVTLGSGGKRQIVCAINAENQTTYSLEVEQISSIYGETNSTIQDWVLDEDWTGRVNNGTTTRPILILDIPRKIENTALKIIVREKNLDTNDEKIHTLYVDVKQIGSSAAMVEKICSW